MITRHEYGERLERARLARDSSFAAMETVPETGWKPRSDGGCCWCGEQGEFIRRTREGWELACVQHVPPDVTLTVSTRKEGGDDDALLGEG